MTIPSIHFLEVVRDGLVDLVLLADELVLHDDGLHHWVAGFHPQHLLSGGVKLLNVPGLEVLLQLVQDLVVVKLAGYLKHLRSLMRLLGRCVPDGLAALPRLGPEAVGDLLGDVVDHGSAVDEGGRVEQALIHALSDDFPDGGLRQGPDVDLAHLRLYPLHPLYAGCLHLDLDEVVVGDLVYRVCHDCVGDYEVPDPHLVELVAFPMRGCLPSQGGYKPGYG